MIEPVLAGLGLGYLVGINGVATVPVEAIVLPCSGQNLFILTNHLGQTLKTAEIVRYGVFQIDQQVVVITAVVAKSYGHLRLQRAVAFTVMGQKAFRAEVPESLVQLRSLFGGVHRDKDLRTGLVGLLRQAAGEHQPLFYGWCRQDIKINLSHAGSGCLLLQEFHQQ